MKDMKTKVVLLSFASALFSLTAFGQTIENDDMYFNSKDRAKLRAQKPTEASYASAKTVKKTESKVEEDFNPTDSYSARNVNPEFTARSNSEMATADNQDYFVNNYKYQTASNLNNWNNNFSNTYNNPWYGSSYYGSSMNSWNSPYYGSSYGMYGNPWCNPYQSGWSGSFSYYTGNAWNYGWNSGWGMDYGYGNPYASYWGPNYGYGYGYGSYYGGGYGYPSTVVIVNNNYEGNGRQYSHGKRGTSGRTSVVDNNETNGSRNRSTVVGPSSGTVSSGGRIATTAPTTRTTSTGRTTRQDDYYNRSWRSTSSSTSTTTTSPSRSSSSNDNWNWNNSSSSPSRSRSSSFDSGGSSSSFTTPSRSSSGGDGGRSSGSSSSGGSNDSGGSRGRTRGN